MTGSVSQLILGFVSLLLLSVGCASAPLSVAPEPGATPIAPTAEEAPVAGESVEESVTVVNDSDLQLTVVRIKSTREGQEPVNIEFGPIAPHESATGTVTVWPGGQFVVEADADENGTVNTSRSFTANLEAGKPITPVTLTLKGHKAGKSHMFMWSGVKWE